MLLLAESAPLGWPGAIAFCFGALMFTIGMEGWPTLVIRRKCSCKKS